MKQKQLSQLKYYLQSRDISKNIIIKHPVLLKFSMDFFNVSHHLR